MICFVEVLTTSYCVCMVGSLDEFLRAYVNKFKFSTVTSLEWKDFFLEFFDKEVHNNYVNCSMTFESSTHKMHIHVFYFNL